MHRHRHAAGQRAAGQVAGRSGGGEFDWLVLTSANTVYALEERLSALGLSVAGASFRVATVGPATAGAAQGQLGLIPADLPEEYAAESLADSLPIQPGTRVLLPESALARPTLENRLVARGAIVTTVTAYQTVCGRGGVDLPALLAQKQVDALTFTSSSTVTYLLERLAREGGLLEAALDVCAACIGAKTAATARECGFRTIITAGEATLDSLVDALEAHFEQTIARE
ncbi:MAG: uroporphyrinogen-III synthase [Anaerolineae bacterium]